MRNELGLDLFTGLGRDCPVSIKYCLHIIICLANIVHTLSKASLVMLVLVDMMPATVYVLRI